MNKLSERAAQPHTPVSMLIGHLAWLAVGPISLVGAAIAVLSRKGEWFTPFDLAFPLVIILMVGGRYLEQKTGHATTSTGEPSTWENFERYTKKAIPIVIVVWGLSKLTAMFLLR